MSCALRLLTWNVKAHSESCIYEAINSACPNAVALQECSGKNIVSPWCASVGTQVRHASAALWVSPDLQPSNPRVVVPGHAVSIDIATPAPARIYSVYARNDSTSPNMATARKEDDTILYADIEASPLPVFVAGDLNLVLRFGDHHTHDRQQLDPNRVPREKVARLMELIERRRLIDSKPPSVRARTHTSRLGGTSRLDYVLAETPASEYMFMDMSLDHSPVVSVYDF